MPAFDKIKSGIQGLDLVLRSIRLGDNVVLQLTNIDEYSFFVKPFVRQAITDNRNIIYMRFAEHPPLLQKQEGLKIFTLDPDVGFESFTVQVNQIIKEEGKEAFYVFDCLSELQSVWAADLMMGNFFRVTCPYLFELDTIAYFGILRNRHSYDTIAQIRDTTQLLIDVFGIENEMYVHPLKVWNRYSPTMFLPHKFEGNTLIPLIDGISVSKFYQLMSTYGISQSDQALDNWDRFFIRAKLEFENGIGDNTQTIENLNKMLIGKDQTLSELIKSQFSLKDFLSIKEKMVGSGSIGGKATGMLLARKIIQNKRPDLFKILEPHDSFFIGSDVFYSFLVQNGWWRLRLEQRTSSGYFSAAKKLKEKLITGLFPENIKEQFKRMLEYFGQTPIVVRSSSLLEDSFGNAFAGKYESIFCVNVGSMEQRFKAFEEAVKLVYASSMNESALSYRKQRGLDKNDEQMAILVQRVSGSLYQDIFMPCAAGVGYSYNSYVWNKDINPKAGLVRLVLGLGTRAVDRTDGDYPRIASLDKPLLSTISDITQKSKFSQRSLDILNLNDNKLQTSSIDNILDKLPSWYKKRMFEHDFEAERFLRERGTYKEVLFTSCENIVQNKELIDIFKEMMQTIQNTYNYPVDIEFTINFSEQGEFVINLLQCRPLQVGGLGIKVNMPKQTPQKTLFSIKNGSMGGSIFQPLDKVILVDPEQYYLSNLSTKYNVARAIGKINQSLKLENKSIMLIGPGRWGTSSPELGVPVTFAEINPIKVLCEVSYEGAGYMPELSFGSHFFQDLVEMEIFYVAIFSNYNEVIYNPQLLANNKNIIDDIITIQPEIKNIISVYKTEGLVLLSDTVSQKTICYFK